MVTKKKTTKKQAKPKTKVVYRTKKVYVEKKNNNDDNPFGETTKMVGQGMGTLMGVTVGMGMIGAVGNAFK
jgi:hypothetical protein